jgi:glycosyltransferase involved in cell wall biosynthesis
MEHPRNLNSEYGKYFVSNVNYEKKGIKNIFFSSLRLLYSFQARKKIEELISVEKPDIAHLHNIYHQISPSILHSLNKFNIPVVMTLHDSKLSCAQYLMTAKNRICEACINKTYYHCFLKACIKNSRLKSLLNTIEMYLHHYILHIYDLIDCFISPSKFLKEKIEKMGFKEKKIIILPNILKTEDYFPRYGCKDNSIVYFGRLSREKGLFVLLEAVKGMKNISLKIIGEGPLKGSLETKIRDEGIDNVTFLGYKSGEQLKNEICDSLFIILPSQCYENNPRAIIEAFALEKPVIGARLGGIPELVIDGKTGLTFESGNAMDLRSKIQYLLDNPSKIQEMGRNARDFAEREFNAQKHYEKLMEIYELAIKLKQTKKK